MPIYKCIHFLNKNTGFPSGWSEVWYIDAANFDQAEDNGRQIASKRAQLLSNVYTIVAQRVTSNIQPIPDPPGRNQRKATFLVLDIIGNAGGAGAADGDLPWTCVNVRWTAGDVSIFRSQLLRGLPDDWFIANDGKLAKAKVDGWAPQMVRVLGLATARIRHKDALAVGGFSYVQPAKGQYIGYTKRDTGRPFGLLRGRQANRPVA